MQRPIRIANIFESDTFDHRNKMSSIRWLKMSAALRQHGFSVDMVSGGRRVESSGNSIVRTEPFDPRRYDVIKTCYQNGYEALEDCGGEDHAFVVSRLATIVGHTDNSSGAYFDSDERRRLFQIQERISQHSRIVALNSHEEATLWAERYGTSTTTCVVPTGVDSKIPQPKKNPYEGIRGRIAVLVGNLRGIPKVMAMKDGEEIHFKTQTRLNERWQLSINELGEQLKRRGIRLCVIGDGDVSLIDRELVSVFPAVDQTSVWDFQYFADVGIALAQGPNQLAESSKIYNYIRSGLPVISESPIANNDVIRAAKLGFIADYGDLEQMAELAQRATLTSWKRAQAIRLVVEQHSWHQRADVYARLIRQLISVDSSSDARS